VPAAAVIPAPIAYIKVVAVKKLVVGSRGRSGGPPRGGFTAAFAALTSPALPGCSSLSARGGRNVYFEKIRVFKAGVLA
jgi:hypothetical protein